VYFTNTAHSFACLSPAIHVSSTRSFIPRDEPLPRWLARRAKRLTPDLLFKQASILRAQAKYDEACAILLRLNRDFPNRPELLKRIVTVYEQLRDVQHASAFLKAYERQVPADPWATATRERYSLIGVR